MQTKTASSLFIGEGLHRLANFEHDLDYVVNHVPEGHQNLLYKVETKVNLTTTDQCRCYHNCQKCSKKHLKKGSYSR